MSTDPRPVRPTGPRLSLDTVLERSPASSIRREGFGGLAYRYADRRLFFVHAPELIDVVEALDGISSVGAILARMNGGDRGRVGEGPALRALDRMAALDVVRVVSPGRAAGVAPAASSLGRDARGGGSATGSKEVFRKGLAAPICLTWEITYGCNLRCAHCLSSSGDERPGELTTEEAKALVEELAAMDVFYVNVGGGEPMTRPDFRELMDHCMDAGVGVKFSTNGTLVDDDAADWIASRGDMLDVQISVDGATTRTSDPLRGNGSFDRAKRAMDRLAERGFGFKVNTVATRDNVDELDALYALARDRGAQLRLTRLRPSGRGRDVWDAMRPTAAQNRVLYDWLHAHPDVLTGDSFFHLSAYGESLDGLNLCGAGRIVCCIDPLGDVYACPFVLDPEFAAGNVRGDGGFRRIWQESPLFSGLRAWQVGGTCRTCNAYAKCHGGCMAVKHATGRDLDGPDPDCVLGNDEGPRNPIRTSLPLAPAHG